MKHIRKFKYGQWDVTIKVKSINGFPVNDYRSELVAVVDCTGTWVSTQGMLTHYTADCVAYNEPEILPDKLKLKITKMCRHMLMYGERYYYSDIDIVM